MLCEEITHQRINRPAMYMLHDFFHFDFST